MKLVFYKDFIREPKLEKTLQQLENENFSQVKKLSNSGYFRIRVNQADRLLFVFLKYENETYILVLEYIPNHEYRKSKFLRGKKVDEEDFKFPEHIEEVIYINEDRTFRYIGNKFVSFSESQKSVLYAQTPIIVVGSAGSGKTSVLIEKLQQLEKSDKKVLYISLSKYLVENSQEDCDCPKVDFSTFQEFFNIENEITFKEFQEFARNHRILEAEKYFEEFRGVIMGMAFDKPYLSEEEYIKLGVKQSLFKENERTSVYKKFIKYLKYLKDNNLVDSNMEQLHNPNRYDLIVIDEVQDFTNAQIYAILKHGDDFILSGDSNQIIYSNAFSWSKLKEMFFKTENDKHISILKENYRTSQTITEVANRLLKIKQLRFGSIDKESNYLINTVSNIEGEIFFWTDRAMIKEIDEKKGDDVNFAVIVFDEVSKRDAKMKFRTPLIFTVQEVKGLEYKNIVIFNFVTKYQKKFRDIVQGINKSDLEKELKFSRNRNKENRELEQYKIYINSLYVAFTRGTENLYIIEEKPHQLWELLGVVESEQVTLEKSLSTKEDWEKEAKRLEKYGKIEHVEEIRKKIEQKETKSQKAEQNKIEKAKPKQKQQQKIELSDTERIVHLKQEIFEKGNNTKQNRDNLFRLAKKASDIVTIREMATKLNFKMAKKYFKELDKLLKKDIAKLVKSNPNSQTVKRILEIDDYVNIQNNEGVTALIIASAFGQKKIVQFLVGNGADVNHKNKEGWTALMIASQNGHKEIVQLLIDKKAKVDIQNNEDVTALILASQNGHKEIVQLLIDNRA
ncbi:MAG TPA: hypothetical protein EYG60_05295, partial [Campylobacterales bacterium]|nr:hypothetical protein [Campylobacterales bacterium]